MKLLLAQSYKGADYIVAPVIGTDGRHEVKLPAGVRLSGRGKLPETEGGKKVLDSNSGKVLAINLGSAKALSAEKVRSAAGAALKELRALGAEKAYFTAWAKGTDMVKAQVEGFLLASYVFDKFRSKKKKHFPSELRFGAAGAGEARAAKEAAMVCGNVMLARDLANSPSNVATPAHIEKQARAVAKKYRMKIRVISREQARNMGMGAFYAVAKGSDTPGRIMVLEYNKGKGRPVAVVGKGITFDSGGISLKPPDSMENMKFDMSGAAAVLYLMKTVAEAGLKKNIVAVIPATENLPSGKAYKPGDILETMSGKTVEVISTDAEGRLILCDAIHYVKQKYNPRAIVDIATLTGACLIALGHYAMGLMSNDEALAETAGMAAKAAGEPAWRLPLFEEYIEYIRGDYADLKNAGGREAGTITAGMFLKEFAGGTPWAHFDIAGTAYNIKHKSYYPAVGASGMGLRALFELMKQI